MTIIFYNAKVFDGDSWIQPGVVVVDAAGIIREVSTSLPAIPDAELINLQGQILTAGFFDIHVHGGYGVYFGSETPEKKHIQKYSTWIAGHGVTNFLTSLVAKDHERLIEILQDYATFFDDQPLGAHLSGVHLEGPYINPLKKGAFNSASIRPANVEEGKRILKIARAFIRQITIAPEIDFAVDVARLFWEEGITVALGHSNATCQQARAALRGYWRHVTHTYNAMTGLHHREPGIVGAVLTSEGIRAEIIADLFHVDPFAIQVLYSCLGSDQIAAITDAMSAAGLPDGEYNDGGRIRVVKDGKSVLPDGTISGSTTTLDQCVRNLVKVVGISLEDALISASRTPARAVGMAHQYGTISAGKKANLIVLNDDLFVKQTYVHGKQVYKG